jgi:hypothetical protein
MRFESIAAVPLGALALGLAVVATGGCGSSSSSSSSSPVTIDAGQVNLQLPPGWKVTKGGAVEPGGAATGSTAAANDASANNDAVPLAHDDPQTSFFKSVGVFQSCLKGLGVKFIGVPDPSNPSSPANDPGYIKGLSTCAARSNIVKALKDVQTAQDNLTPAQVKTQNQAYLKWRDCMIARGWGIPTPKPDSKGRLFSFGSTSGPPQFTPPPGQDILSSKDVSDCAAQSQRDVQANGGG